MPDALLKKFFAVTVSDHSRSVYRVTYNPMDRKLEVVKVALSGESGVPVGGRLNEKDLVGISRNGLQLYTDELSHFLDDHEVLSLRRYAEEVNAFHHGGHTSPIVALFFTLEVADDCFTEEDLMPADLRWRKETEKVLNAIGDRHPVFVPSKGHFGLFSE